MPNSTRASYLHPPSSTVRLLPCPSHQTMAQSPREPRHRVLKSPEEVLNLSSPVLLVRTRLSGKLSVCVLIASHPRRPTSGDRNQILKLCFIQRLWEGSRATHLRQDKTKKPKQPLPSIISQPWAIGGGEAEAVWISADLSLGPLVRRLTTLGRLVLTTLLLLSTCVLFPRPVDVWDLVLERLSPLRFSRYQPYAPPRTSGLGEVGGGDNAKQGNNEQRMLSKLLITCICRFLFIILSTNVPL